MKRRTIERELRQYFSAYELVSPQVYKKFGASSYQFFSTDLLHTLLVIRKTLGLPITINNWHNGGRFTQRGLRDNLTPIFAKKFEKQNLYLSGHVLGMAVDFDVARMTATQVREWLVENADLLPTKIRLERNLNGKEINWCHLDCKYVESNPKVLLFDV